jgi:cholesterol transport system auxiliary component
MDRRLLLTSLLLTGCSAASLPQAYDLYSPLDNLPKSARSKGQLTVAEPKTIAALDTERMAVKEPSGAISYLSDGVFADRLPRLLQTRLVQAFESTNRLASVGRVGERLASDFQLLTDIRQFYVETATQNAHIELAVKLMNDKNGRILEANIFTQSHPLLEVKAAATAQAFDLALKTILEQVIIWAIKRV